MHGIDGQVYSLISSATTSMTARFVYLSSGVCPVLDSGRAASACYSHPGSYLGAIGVQQRVVSAHSGSTVSQLQVEAGTAEHGFERVELDGVRLSVGAVYSSGSSASSSSNSSDDSFALHWLDRHTIELSTADFTVQLENSDHFINIVSIVPRVSLHQITAHGLLGQTTKATRHQSTLKVIEGDVDDYAIADNTLMGTDFVYNRFMATPTSSSSSDEQQS